MKEKYKELIIIFLFIFLAIFTFRNYFLNKTVPFPANLLVSFYQPWISYEKEDYPSGPSNKPIGFDNLRIFYPLRRLTIDQLRNFDLPLWNPYNFSGNTHLATYQSAVLHPLSFLFLVLPQIDAWSLIIIIQPFLVSLFMYLFLRENTLSRRSSFFGAIVFAFSGYMVVWWEESLMSVYSGLFLPLILFAIQKLFKKITWWGFAILVFSLSFSILSGWFQTTFYTWVFGFLWAVYIFLKDINLRKQAFFLISFSYLLALIISAIHLIPGIEAYLNSARGTTDAKFVFDLYLLPLYNLITFIAPDYLGNPGTYNYIGSGFFYEKVFFIGIPAFIFLLYELINIKQIIKNENFFKLSFVITLSLGFSLPTSWFLLYYLKIPFISAIIPTRIFFLTTFCASVLVAGGAERYLKEVKIKRILIIFLLLAVSILGLWFFAWLYKQNNPYSIFKTVPLKNMILPSIIYVLNLIIIIVGLKLMRLRPKVITMVIIISFLSSLYFANKYLYFSDRKFIYPQVPIITKLKEISKYDRFWGVGDGYMDRNYATYFNLFSPEGYDSFYIQRYGELLFSIQNKGRYSKQIPRTDATLSFVKNMNEIYNNKFRVKLLSLLGIKYIITSINDESLKQDLKSVFNLKWQDNKFKIYEYKKVLPRVFMTNSYIVAVKEQEILDKLFDDKTELSKTIILEEKIINFTNNKKTKGNATIVLYAPNKIRIKTNADEDNLLFISDNYYPGWKAYVDGKETKIYRANYSFRALIVPEGSHVVEFQYKPQSFYLGVVFSLVGLLIFLVISIRIKETRLA